jgi:hypothetical protein
LQQLAAAQRAGQIDVLPRQVSVQIKRAGIQEIPRRPGAQERLDAIARAQIFGRAGHTRIAIQIGAQPAAHRQAPARHFHCFEIDFVAPPPGKIQRVLAQAAAPAQRLGCVQASRGDQPGHVIGRHRRAFNTRRQAPERHPRGQRQRTGRRNPLSPRQKRSQKNRRQRRDHPDPRPLQRSRPPRRQRDAGRERRRDPQRWQFHGRRRSRTTASM